MGGIFGGSKQKATNTSQSQSTSNSVNDSRSWNNAFPQIQEQFSGAAGQTGQATNALSALLGLGGDPSAQQGAFNNFKDSTGYQFKMDQGTDAITGSAAAKGLLNSGSTAKGLTTFGQGLADSTFNDYLSNLFNLGNVGLQAGQLISGAGQESTSHGESSSQSTASSSGTSSGKSKPGIGGLVGSLGAGIAASDRRLKKDIEPLYKLKNGLRVYRYKYVNDNGPYIGVMADEVQKVMPEALGPVIDGYMTVNYDKLGGL